ncbi:MAG: sensor histidine kinase [Gammaproteobacteria bacterium]
MKITPTILLAVLWLTLLGWGFHALLRRHLRLDDQLADKEAELSIERHARHVAERSLANTHLALCQLAREQEGVREQERQRIARDIHDDLGQNLLALKIDLSLLHVSTTGAHPMISQKVDTMIGHIDLTISSLRAIIHDLRPSALDEGFVHAIEWQLGEFTRMHGIRHESQIDPAVLPDGADRELETMLYRIVQEALSNVARHAHATDVIVQLARSGSVLNLKIQDNGSGIPAISEHHGSGLAGMRERVRALGGKMHIDSVDGIGTILTLSIPLNETVALS